MGNVGVKPDTLADGAINEKTDTVITAADEIIFGDVTDSNNLKKDTIQGILDLRGAGAIVQVVNVHDGAVSTSTTTLPGDDSITQNTEGFELMTLAITPTNTSNKLIIEVVASLSHSVATQCSIALFQDSTAGALAAVGHYQTTGTGAVEHTLIHYMTAGTVSATTFKVRGGGGNAGTATFNGVTAGRLFGGVMASSITITEISV